MNKSLKHILSLISKADYEFSLIDQGDKIAVGVSGGKDSMLLLKALKNYTLFPNKKFSFIAVFLDLGFGNVDIETLSKFCYELNIPLHIENSREVYQILSCHKNKDGHLPCSICSRMKKAAINKVAHEYQCNKVAFAHHFDDALETLLMNTIYGGKLSTFAPKMHLETTDLVFIRPFILVREQYIINTVKNEQIPVIKSKCPNDHITMREEAKNMLHALYKKYPEAYQNYFNLLFSYENFDLWNDKKEFPLFPHYYVKKASTSKEWLQGYQLFSDSINDMEVNHESDIYIVKHENKVILSASILKLDKNHFHIYKIGYLNDDEALIKAFISFLEFDISKKINPLIFSYNHNLNEKYFTSYIDGKKTINNVKKFFK